jgi:hypothetical protein
MREINRRIGENKANKARLRSMTQVYCNCSLRSKQEGGPYLNIKSLCARRHTRLGHHSSIEFGLQLACFTIISV